jgi:hypothetical protein
MCPAMFDLTALLNTRCLLSVQCQPRITPRQAGSFVTRCRARTARPPHGFSSSFPRRHRQFRVHLPANLRDRVPAARTFPTWLSIYRYIYSAPPVPRLAASPPSPAVLASSHVCRLLPRRRETEVEHRRNDDAGEI